MQHHININALYLSFQDIIKINNAPIKAVILLLSIEVINISRLLPQKIT